MNEPQTPATEIARVIADETDFLLRAKISTHSKADSITAILTNELNLRTHDKCGQIDQRTVDIEFVISSVLERIIAKWETTQELYNKSH